MSYLRRVVITNIIFFILVTGDPAHSQEYFLVSALAEAFEALWNIILCFWIGWTLSYTAIGTWLEVKLVKKRVPEHGVSKNRYGPVLSLHLLFSLVFINPYLLFVAYLTLPKYPVPVYSLSLFVWMVLIPVCLDSLLLRVVPGWAFFRWFRWNPPIKGALLWSFVSVIVSLAIGAGFMVIGLYLFV